MVIGAALVPIVLTRCRDSGQVERSDSVFSIAVGDCIQPPAEIAAADIEDIPALPCSEPHSHEVFGFTSYTDADVYPGANELQAFADRPPTPVGRMATLGAGLVASRV